MKQFRVSFTISSGMAEKTIGSSKVFQPIFHPQLSTAVVVGTFHFGRTCAGLTHNYAGQRLDEGSVVERCSWGLEVNEKEPDGKHTVAFY